VLSSSEIVIQVVVYDRQTNDVFGHIKLSLNLFLSPQIGTIEKRRLSKFDVIKSIQSLWTF
jgi:hypothetical protein